MLAFEDEPVRKMFAVYVRPEGERGLINFYPDEQTARDDVGPGMPVGYITEGDTYVEYIGDALLYAPSEWPLIGVDQDLLVQLEADDFEIFLALTPAESDALMLLVTDEGEDGVDALPEFAELEDAEELIDAPAGVSGTEPCAVWTPEGELIIFASGPDGGGRQVSTLSPRPEFDDEVATDRAVVKLFDAGWVPLVGDPTSWREEGPYWVINTQQRVRGDSELFFGRYTADDRSLVVTRAGIDTEDQDEHLQVVAEDVPCEFDQLVALLQEASWLVEVDATEAAEISVHPELSESPGWYPAETDEGVEWVCSVSRIEP